MKKHFILTSLFAFTVIVNAQAQTLVAAERQTPGIGLENIYRMAEQRSGAFNSRGYDHGRDERGDCDKCHKGKKSKKHGACGKPGKHYGKHKHRGNHCGSCRNSCCESGRNRDCNDNDRWSERNRRDQPDDRWDGRNRRDRRDDNNRRFTSTRGDRDDQYRGNSRSSQRKAASTGQSKTNRPDTARRAGSRPGGARQ